MGKEHDDWLSNALGLAADTFRSGAQTVGGALTDAAEGAADFAGRAFNAGAGIVDAGEAALSSAAQAASSAASAAAGAATGIAGGAAAGAKKVVAVFIPGEASGPMAADCKPVKGHVPGPAHHILCQTHGHVLDTKAGQIIAASVEEYKQTFKNGQLVSFIDRAQDAALELIDDAANALSTASDTALEEFESLAESGALQNDARGPDDRGGKDAPPPGLESPSLAEQAKRALDSLFAERPTPEEREREEDLPKEAFKKASEGALEQLFKTKVGKEIEAAAEKELDKIPPFVRIAIPVSILASATVGLAATGGEFPVEESPEFTFIRLGGIPIKVKLKWKGPVDQPKEVTATFSFDIPSGEARPRVQQNSDGPSSRLEPSGAFKDRKEGAPVVVANFDHGQMKFSQVLKALEGPTRDASGGRILVQAFFTPAEEGAPPPDPREVAESQASQMRSAIEQMVDRRRFRVEAIAPRFKGAGGSLVRSDVGTRDMAVIFIPFR